MTMRLDGRLVAFVAGLLDDNLVAIHHVCLATWLRARHPEIASRVIDAFVASVNTRPESGTPGLWNPPILDDFDFDAEFARLLEQG
ncbi:MAG: hypothetical protein Q4G51_16235 [Dermatophilus congolensis]|nr:hypothetical protein [Dermatophilus congolensis]